MTKQIEFLEGSVPSDKNKYRNLILGLVFDMIGNLSYIIPGVAEFTDIIWAPISSFLISRMYKGNVGKIAGVFSFIEEALPGFDVIPTFTITWFYTYVFNKNKI